MKKILIIVALALGAQAFAQSAPLNGVTLVQVEDNIQYFTITDEFQSYTLHRALIAECESYTIIDDEILGPDALHGVFFYFKNEKVLYILCKGGLTKGSVIRK